MRARIGGVATIVRMGPEQWERVRAIRLRALRDTPDAFATTAADEELREPESWRARLASPEAATFVAREGAEDVGLVTGAAFRGRAGAAGLFGMWVAPAARGTGVGDGLVEAVVAWARAAAYARAVLEVGDVNDAAIRLYERHGFAPTGATGTLPPPRTHVREHERALEL
jgi:GNAT superfamily N-acetyltransferase